MSLPLSTLAQRLSDTALHEDSVRQTRSCSAGTPIPASSIIQGELIVPFVCSTRSYGYRSILPNLYKTYTRACTQSRALSPESFTNSPERPLSSDIACRIQTGAGARNPKLPIVNPFHTLRIYRIQRPRGNTHETQGNSEIKQTDQKGLHPQADVISIGNAPYSALGWRIEDIQYVCTYTGGAVQAHASHCHCQQVNRAKSYFFFFFFFSCK